MVTTVDGAGKAQAATQPKTHFEGWHINSKTHQLEGPYHPFWSKSSLESAQKKYDEQRAKNAKAEDQEVSFVMKPFYFAGRAVRNLFGLITNAFKAVFSICFSFEKSESTEKKTAKAGN